MRTAVTLQATAPADAVGRRAALWWARVVCISAFGPYLTGNARTEQIAVFLSFGAILIVGWPRIVNARSYALMPMLLLWLSLCAVMLVGTMSRPLDLGFYGPQPISHGLTLFLLPVVLIILTWYWTLIVTVSELIGAIAKVIVVGMIANSVISLAQLITGNVTVLSFLPRFWTGATSASSGAVAVLAAENGRFTGIFDQPAEAGIAYGLALFCLIYLAQRRVLTSSRIVTACAVVLITGGTLTISKIFLLGAIPLSVLVIIRSRRGRIRVVASAALGALALWLLAGAGLLTEWPAGSAMVRGLMHPDGSLAAAYSAGRYGSGGTLGPVMSDILRSSPWYGFGAGGLNVPYDSLWVEALAVAGVFGVAALAFVLALLAYRWLRLRGVLERPEWLLGGASLALAIGGSLGFPSLTGDRVATPLWLIIGILIAAQPPWMPSHDPRPQPSSFRAVTGGPAASC